MKIGSAKRNMGRNLVAREAHFRKAGATEKTGRERIKERRQEDHQEEREAQNREPSDVE